MEFKDYYALLGVEPEADEATIKTAYRRLARKYHPDISQEKDAEAKFKEVAEAWQVLKDPDKRADYDQLRAMRSQQGGRGPFEAPPGWQPSGGGGFDPSGAGFSDFFESLFSGARQGGRGGPAPGRRGRDVEIDLPVFLEDTVSSETKPISFRLPEYNQYGELIGETTKSLNVKIPAGVSDGERIRLKGQGSAGVGDMPAGDVYLRIRLVPHPLFDVEGHNLIVTVPVAPWEAALGAKIEVPTLASPIKVSIPANSQSGKKLRIAGKGLPGKAGQGDLFVLLKVVMPPASSDEINQLWEQLAEKASFDPRAQWSR
ncbi:DnaJ C-terminal domain-containing protein [Alcanivorax sp. 1008]|uniref:DnaJ C-terminal domain-containing protein n=1 Tax=Alcanivorax sp. 1008 TaxID=2816853 RepID=UPI001D82B9D5|nr:DnaJ C-terminal domain-containing protein [Alcanivorax sp. 1008]MCC1495350.1 DnaJ domain-containing protein [Alcanivorax sp. 1008]